MDRREWLGVALGGLSAAGAGGAPRYRAAIIGQTGDGDYGHDWDTAWNDIPSVDVVAVVDANEAGRRRAAQRSRAQRQYADYREMLQKERPNFVGICSRVINRSRLRKPSEPVGPIAGNQIAAMFAFHHGVHAYFGSKSSDVPDGSRFGFSLYGSKGVIRIPITKNPGGEPIILRSRSWVEGPKDAGWQRIDAPGGKSVDTREEANRIMAIDLIQAVEQNRQPARCAIDGRWTVEMLQGIYLSQNRGARVEFPSKDRRHPLEEL